MNEQSTPDFPLPYSPDQQPSKKVRKHYKTLVLAFAAVGFALVAATSAYLWMNRSNEADAPTIRSVTYYYRDGKTVLWQGARLAEADSPTFIHAVADELLARYGEATMKKGGEWKIVTTLDQSLQQTAVQQVEAQRQQMDRQRAKDAALVAQDISTGQIVSWVGGLEDKLMVNGKDRLRSATQPGTLALPLVYAAYIDNNTDVNANTVVEDTEGPLPGYSCTPGTNTCLKNFDRKYLGQLTLRKALGMHRLVPAVKAVTSVVPDDSSPNRVTSINKFITTTRTMMADDHGYSCYEPGSDTKETQCYAAAALGDGVYATPQDLIQTYATLSNNGKRLRQTSLLKVGLNGKTVEEWKAGKSKQAIKENTAGIITDILSDQDATYMTRKSWFRLADTKISVIAGTHDDQTVAGTVQYSSKYAVGFWVFGSEEANGAMTGFTETIVLPPASGWLATAHGARE